GQFSFLVARNVTKPAVAQAVEEQFKVNAIRVTISSVKGKTRRTGKRRLTSRGQNQKKAILTLKAGQTIEYFKIPEPKK
ncbi:50S ribosomal protein L23, partial [Patescibacteria group bacterium]|nr:50S ribosomal protein L23 [Patescibacteria group bacterium]